VNIGVLVRLLVGLALVALLLLVVYLVLNGDDEAVERERVLAPIDAMDIVVLESFPPQYVLTVVAGLPNGCARADGHEVDRVLDTVRVRIYNTVPVGKVACIQVYRTYQLSIPLGSDLQSGRDYTVDVNGQTRKLTPQ
jgi:hypothetical protein